MTSGTVEHDRLQWLSLAGVAEALASAAPTPGGGCAAAVPGALAAGLVAMVARQTAVGDPFGDLSFDMDAVAQEADRLRVDLLGLVDDDTSAFDDVITALRRPEGTPGRARRAQDAYRAAVEPSMDVCRRSLRVLELAAEVAERGNPNAAPDAGVAALLAAASVDAAALDVRAGLRPIRDDVLRAERDGELRGALASARALRGAALAAVHARLGDGGGETPRHPARAARAARARAARTAAESDSTS